MTVAVFSADIPVAYPIIMITQFQWVSEFSHFQTIKEGDDEEDIANVARF
jgi:hypothetical protein